MLAKKEGGDEATVANKSELEGKKEALKQFYGFLADTLSHFCPKWNQISKKACLDGVSRSSFPCSEISPS